MADVFISYKREREHAAAHLADIIEANGYSVWWDRELKAGDEFSPEIEAELASARAVVVLWCSLSVKTPWVLKEAGDARERKIIIPAWLQSVDLPRDFDQLTTLNLARWDGNPVGELSRLLLTNIAFRVGIYPDPKRAELDRYSELWHRFGRPNLAQLAQFGRDPASPAQRLVPMFGRVRHKPKRAAPTAQQLADLRKTWDGLKTIQNRSAFEGFVRVVLENAPHTEIAFEVESHLQALAEVDEPIESGQAAERGRPTAERMFRVTLYGHPGWPHPEMVAIPSGGFWMGAKDGEEEPDSWSRPQHRVEIDRAFAIGKHPVTREAIECWKAALGHPNRLSECGAAPRHAGSRHPATHVHKKDALEFIDWLNEVKKLKGRVDCYRLPTEAEWEYACRALVDGPAHAPRYSVGEAISDTQANFAIHTDRDYRQIQRTTEVGQHHANAFGICDMHGNVWEWVEDVWNPHYANGPFDWRPRMSGEAEFGTLRGGSWYDLAVSVRSASRTRTSLDDRNYKTGFRLCRTLPPNR